MRGRNPTLENSMNRVDWLVVSSLMETSYPSSNFQSLCCVLDWTKQNNQIPIPDQTPYVFSISLSLSLSLFLYCCEREKIQLVVQLELIEYSFFSFSSFMEFFSKAKAVRLRSHLGKYLIAEDDQETVRQTRNSSSTNVIWMVEAVEEKSHCIRLKNCYGSYLKATDSDFLIGVTGRKVVQFSPEKLSDWRIQWEPVREGHQVKLRSWCGTYLRANGGTPPWRNSITHDEPHAASTQKWILWDVDAVEAPSSESVVSSVSSVSSRSSSIISVGESMDSEQNSPAMKAVGVKSSKLFSKQINVSSGKFRSGMDLLHNAGAVRLRSRHEKYLTADDDEESVTQDRSGSSKKARWVVEFVCGSDSAIRLKSCYGKYLTASNQLFLLGMTGRKVLQTLPKRLDSSVEWEPVREGAQIMLKTRYGNFLRANGGVPPWRNSVTHDVPHRTATQDWIVWNVDVLDILVKSPCSEHPGQPVPYPDSLDHPGSASPSSDSFKSDQLSATESMDSGRSSPPKSEGRTINYHVVNENEDRNDKAAECYSFTFKGNGVEELTRKLEEETGLDGIIVCTRNPVNGNPYPLRLQLPPNNASMNLVIVLKSSKAAKDFANQGLL